MTATAIERASKALDTATAVVVLAGAGAGVDSGMPDFRSEGGFYKAYPALKGLSFIDMASPSSFTHDPELGWAFYGHRLNMYREIEPHSGYDLLRDYAASLDDGYFVFTSNVDGHFQKAGYDEAKILECHGSLHHLQCSEARFCAPAIWSADSVKISIREDEFLAERDTIPLCPQCTRVARPNVLLFGDGDWVGTRTSEQRARYSGWLRALSSETELAIVEMGAGTAVPTVRWESESLLRRFPRSTLVRLNVRESDVPNVDNAISLPVGALEGLERIFGV